MPAPKSSSAAAKAIPLARKLKVPLIRAGAFRCNRIDGLRDVTWVTKGAATRSNRIGNALIGAAEDASPVGYAST